MVVREYIEKMTELIPDGEVQIVQNDSIQYRNTMTGMSKDNQCKYLNAKVLGVSMLWSTDFDTETKEYRTLISIG